MQYIIVSTDTVSHNPELIWIIPWKVALGTFAGEKWQESQESSCSIPSHSHNQTMKEITA